jgi:hypothetical protein
MKPHEEMLNLMSWVQANMSDLMDENNDVDELGGVIFNFTGKYPSVRHKGITVELNHIVSSLFNTTNTEISLSWDYSDKSIDITSIVWEDYFAEIKRIFKDNDFVCEDCGTRQYHVDDLDEDNVCTECVQSEIDGRIDTKAEIIYEERKGN